MLSQACLWSYCSPCVQPIDCCGYETSEIYCEECACKDCTFGEPCVEGVLPSTAGCEVIQFAADNICDDGNNNAACAWDGGDCCGLGNSYDYCTACECLDCEFTEHVSDECVDSIQRTCSFPIYQGDGICDTDNNVAGCDWDGGDCCGPSNDYRYCGDDCECLDCTFEHPSDECVDMITGSCGVQQFMGDGFCDDDNNNAGCDWDGGDCCSSASSYAFCSSCQCLDCTVAGTQSDECTDAITGYCGTLYYVGDGYCDSENNNAGCDWDSGDCCGPDVSMIYCQSGDLCT